MRVSTLARLAGLRPRIAARRGWRDLLLELANPLPRSAPAIGPGRAAARPDAGARRDPANRASKALARGAGGSAERAGQRRQPSTAARWNVDLRTRQSHTRASRPLPFPHPRGRSRADGRWPPARQLAAVALAAAGASHGSSLSQPHVAWRCPLSPSKRVGHALEVARPLAAERLTGSPQSASIRHSTRAARFQRPRCDAMRPRPLRRRCHATAQAAVNCSLRATRQRASVCWLRDRAWWAKAEASRISRGSKGAGAARLATGRQWRRPCSCRPKTMPRRPNKQHTFQGSHFSLAICRKVSVKCTACRRKEAGLAAAALDRLRPRRASCRAPGPDRCRGRQNLPTLCRQ